MCVSNSMPFHRVLIHLTITIKIRNYSITTKISLRFPFVVAAHPLPPNSISNPWQSLILSFQDCYTKAVKHDIIF